MRWTNPAADDFLSHGAALTGLTHDLGKTDPHFQTRMIHGARQPLSMVRHEQWSAALMQSWLWPYLAGQSVDWTATWGNKENRDMRYTYTPLGCVEMAVATHHFQYHQNSPYTDPPSHRHPQEREKVRPFYLAPHEKNAANTSDWTGMVVDPLTDPLLWDGWRDAIQRHHAGFSKMPEHLAETRSFEAAWPAAYLDLRQALMLGDHSVSSRDLTPSEHQAPGADPVGAPKRLANPDRPNASPGKRQVAHPLMPHLMAVGNAAKDMMVSLRSLRTRFPGVARHIKDWDPPAGAEYPMAPGLERYQWQRDLQRMLAQETQGRRGVFGILAADTGAGKTKGAAMAMAAMTGEEPLRWNLLLNLRSLTEQSARAYVQGLGLGKHELLMVMGETFVDPHAEQALDYGNPEEPAWDVKLPDSLKSQDTQGADRLTDWKTIAADRKDLHHAGRHDLGVVMEHRHDQAALAAPVMVATVDQLMRAADGRRTHFQKAQLRLRTADTLIEEVDHYDPKDWPALARLCRTIGALGSRLIIASATLSPKQAKALMQAYAAGYRSRAALEGWDKDITVFAAADRGPHSVHFETVSVDTVIETQKPGALAWSETFYRTAVAQWQADAAQCPWVTGRAVVRWAKVDPQGEQQARQWLIKAKDETGNVQISEQQGVAAWWKHIQWHHDTKYTVIPTRTPEGEEEYLHLSMGLIRLYRTQDVARLAAHLAAHPPKGVEVRVMAYHARMVRGVRARMEQTLDALLGPHEESWRRPSGEFGRYQQDALKKEQAQLLQTHLRLPVNPSQGNTGSTPSRVRKVIVVVVASPVEEVGRDHDFDWGIFEPITPQSLIQALGRLFRHRSLALLRALSKSAQQLAFASVLEAPLFFPPSFVKQYLHSVTRKREMIPSWSEVLALADPCWKDADMSWLADAQGHVLRQVHTNEAHMPSKTVEIWTHNNRLLVHGVQNRSDPLKQGPLNKQGWGHEDWCTADHATDFPFRDKTATPHWIAVKSDGLWKWQQVSVVKPFTGKGVTLDHVQCVNVQGERLMDLPLDSEHHLINQWAWEEALINATAIDPQGNPSDELKMAGNNKKRDQCWCPYLGELDPF